MKALDGLKTILGILITLSPLIGTAMGYETSPDFNGDTTEIASAFVALVGGAITFYGRIVAKAPLWFAKKV